MTNVKLLINIKVCRCCDHRIFAQSDPIVKKIFLDCDGLWKCEDNDLGWSEPSIDPFWKVNLAFAIVVGLLPRVVCHKIPVLGTIPLCVPQLCLDWMDCTGLCKSFTIEDCTELQQDCLDWMRIVTDLWTCNRHFNPKNPFTIDKILTKSNFLINVNVVQLRDFSGSSYAHFPPLGTKYIAPF